MDIRHFINGHELQKQQRYAEAIREFECALKHDAEMCYAHSAIAVSYYYLNQFVLALDAANKAVCLCPKVSRFQYQKGVILYSLERILEAIETYNVAIDVNESVPDYYCARGVAYERLFRWSDALSDFDKALQLSSNSLHANLHMADLLATCEDERVRSKVCLQYATRARLISGNNNWKVFAVLAASHAENDDWISAERAANRALRLAPDPEKPRRLLRIKQIRNHIKIRRNNGLVDMDSKADYNQESSGVDEML